MSSHNIRLLVVNHTTMYGGAERNLTDILKRLPQNKGQIIGVVAPGQGAFIGEMQKIGVHCIDLPVPHFAGLRSPNSIIAEVIKWNRFQNAMDECIRREQPNLVYANSPHAAIAVSPVLKRNNLPWLWQIPDLIKNEWVNRQVLRSAINNTNAIMAVSQATLDSIIGLGADPAKVHLVYCAVDVKSFNFDKKDLVEFRLEEGIELDAPLIGMFGQITSWKGWHVLVEAIPKIVSVFPNTRFIFVGRPTIRADQFYMTKLKKRLSDISCSQSVIWTGFREDVPRIMQACDVIVHASVCPEPLGVVIMEGMAARRPVICARGGGTEEMVMSGTGFALPPGDVDALAYCIIELINNPKLCTEMGRNGYQLVKVKFTHEQRVSAYVEMFEQIISKRISPSQVSVCSHLMV